MSPIPEQRVLSPDSATHMCHFVPAFPFCCRPEADKIALDLQTETGQCAAWKSFIKRRGRRVSSLASVKHGADRFGASYDDGTPHAIGQFPTSTALEIPPVPFRP